MKYCARPRGTMASALKRASKCAGKEKRKRKPEVSDSEDSDELIAELEAEQRKKSLKRDLREQEDAEAILKEKYEKQKAKNALALQALAAVRNKYPVMLYIKICNLFY
jgi:hypothetical protein